MKTYHEADSIELVFSGTNYFGVLEKMIDESKDSIHLQTYIFETDETGQHILNALKRAALRNVQVFVLVDAYGSYPFPAHVISDLKNSGIKFRLFSPLFSSESVYFGRRLHHKIIVTDKKTALTGGINIANKYKGTEENAWLDYAVLTKGKVCEYLHYLCESFYYRQTSPQLKKWEKSESSQKNALWTHRIRFRRNDWIKRKNEIHKSYAEAIINAEKSIVIVASYFLPGTTFRQLLKAAAARGVEIKIILAGRSDISSLRLAEHYLFDFYVKNNIRIYEWADSVMHGKAMVVDSKWATVGSYNLNFLSHYISIELNTDIEDENFTTALTSHLNQIMADNCKTIEYNPEKERRRPFLRTKTWLAYNFYRWLMNLLMVGRKYRNRKHNA